MTPNPEIHPFHSLLFEGVSIRMRLEPHGEAWFVAADVCAALEQHQLGRSLSALREEERCLHCQEGPGSDGLTLGLINEAGLLRLLLVGSSERARRMRRWLTHLVLPSLDQGHQPLARLLQPVAAGEAAPIPKAVRRLAEELMVLSGGSDQASENPFNRIADPPMEARLDTEQLAQQLGSSIRSANQQLAACGLQVRNEDDHWQLTEAGLDWGLHRPAKGPGLLRQQRILWHPAVVTLLRQEA